MEQVCSAHLVQEIKQHKSRLTVEIERSTRSHFCDVTKVGLLLWQHLYYHELHVLALLAAFTEVSSSISSSRSISQLSPPPPTIKNK